MSALSLIERAENSRAARELRSGQSESRKVEDGKYTPMIADALENTQLGENVLHVLLDRVLGDEQTIRDRLVRASLGHQRQHLTLPLSQALDRVVARPPARHELGDH